MNLKEKINQHELVKNIQLYTKTYQIKIISIYYFETKLRNLEMTGAKTHENLGNKHALNKTFLFLNSFHKVSGGDLLAIFC